MNRTTFYKLVDLNLIWTTTLPKLGWPLKRLASLGASNGLHASFKTRLGGGDFMRLVL